MSAMQFNTGTPSLVSYTRDLASDPSTAASPLFSDQRVKDALNDVYLELREAARQQGGGSGHKRSYADTVAGQIFYELPSDFHRMVMVEVEYNGQDLTGTAPTSSFLRPIGADVGLELVEGPASNNKANYFIHDQHLGLTLPVITAGVNSLRITYEAGTVEMVSDDDIPDIPSNFHRLLCYKAAIVLRLSMDLPINEMSLRLRWQG
jgi:hypothetical protein